MTSLTSLIERVEAATEGSRELDRLVACIAGWHRVEPRFMRSKHGGWIAPQDWIGKHSDGSPILDSLHGTDIHREVPKFSASIDAALTLLPEGLEFEFTNLYAVAVACMGLNTEVPCYARREDGNITLAILAAILRARQTEARHDES